MDRTLSRRLWGIALLGSALLAGLLVVYVVLNPSAFGGMGVRPMAVVALLLVAMLVILWEARKLLR